MKRCQRGFRRSVLSLRGLLAALAVRPAALLLLGERHSLAARTGVEPALGLAAGLSKRILQVRLPGGADAGNARQPHPPARPDGGQAGVAEPGYRDRADARIPRQFFDGQRPQVPVQKLVAQAPVVPVTVGGQLSAGGAQPTLLLADGRANPALPLRRRAAGVAQVQNDKRNDRSGGQQAEKDEDDSLHARTGPGCGVTKT
jgi:hypothetical protein